MADEPFLNLVLLVCRIVVENDVNGLVLRDLVLDPTQKADELLMPVPLHVLGNDCAVEHIERGKQRGRAVPLVIMGHGSGTALLHRQARLGAVKCLDLGLLVEGQHHRMSRRRDIEAGDIVKLLGESRIVGQLELPPAMRTEAMRFPDRLDGRGCQAGNVRHRAQCPMGRLVGRRLLRQPDDLSYAVGRNRCLTGRPGLIPQQTIDALVHEALLPAPNAGLGLAGLGHDSRGSTALAAQKNNPRSPDVLLRTHRISDDRPQSLTIAGRQGEGNTFAHARKLAHHNTTGIPNRTHMIRSIQCLCY